QRAAEGAGEIAGPGEGGRGTVVEDQIADQTAAEPRGHADHAEAHYVEVQPGRERPRGDAHDEHAHEVEDAEEVVGDQELKRIHPETVVLRAAARHRAVTCPTLLGSGYERT